MLFWKELKMEQREFNNICFITESGTQIGYGHLYRSIALAKEFSKRGCKVEIVIDDEKGKKILSDHLSDINVRALSYVVKNTACFKYVFLDVFKNSWRNYIDFVENNSFQTQFVSIIDDAFLDYALKTDYIFAIGFQNYKLKLETIAREKGKKTKKYTGNDLFIFREEFKGKKTLKIKSEVDNIFVSMGGSDPYKLTELVARSFKLLNRSLVFNYVLGIGFDESRVAKLYELAEKEGFTIYINKNVNDIASLMLENDIAIINGGNTRFELVLLGIPFVSISFNETQNNIANRLETYGFGKNIGVYHNLQTNEIINYIEYHLLPYHSRLKMAENFDHKLNDSGATNIYKLINNKIDV